MKEIIQTEKAPKAIGTYSQAVKVGNIIFISGQIPLDPKTMQLVVGDFKAQVRQAFCNLEQICKAASLNFENIAKLNIYVTDLSYFDEVNQVMSELFTSSYPARAVVEVSGLPKGASFEVDAILVRQ
jgi:reactive intermediate/imine deaminase